MSRFYTLPLADVRKETSNAVSVAFAVPPEHKDVFRFEPGQYLTLRADIDGRSVRRPYSICSGPSEPTLRVGIKAVPGGRFSTFAQTLKAGDTLDVMPPAGNFRWLSPTERAPDERPSHHLAFAAGSGITPILSIAQGVLRERPKDTFTLLYGNRGQGSVMFAEALHELKDQALTRFRIHHLFSREQTDIDLHHGRLDGPRIRAMAECGYFDPASVDVVYACGPGPMNEAVQQTLSALGTPADRIRFERFTAAQREGPPPSVAAEAAETARHEVHAVVDGVRRTLRMRAEENVIAAAERQGIELPYACAGGMCCTCRCKVVEGEVDMDVCYSLEKWELDAGFVLACQSHPKTEQVVLDFDAR